jgi:hypothetical protein
MLCDVIVEIVHNLNQISLLDIGFLKLLIYSFVWFGSTDLIQSKKWVWYFGRVCGFLAVYAMVCGFLAATGPGENAQRPKEPIGEKVYLLPSNKEFWTTILGIFEVFYASNVTFLKNLT